MCRGSQIQDTQDVLGGHRPKTHRVCTGVTGPGHTGCILGSQAQDTQSVQEGGAGQDAQDVEGGLQTQDTQRVQRGQLGHEGSWGGNHQKKERKRETAKWWPYWGQKACQINRVSLHPGVQLGKGPRAAALAGLGLPVIPSGSQEKQHAMESALNPFAALSGGGGSKRKKQSREFSSRRASQVCQLN